MRPFSLLVQAATHPRTVAHGRAASLHAARPPCAPSVRTFHKGPRDTVTSHPHPDEFSFERLGLRPAVLTALRLAFPSVKHPTPIQHRFIDAVLKGNDVLLKDKTGTGKSFAAVLALLSQKRGPPYKSDVPGLTAPVLPITSLILVPHRDLAYQFYHWIEHIHHHMTPQEPLPSLAQVFIRDSTRPMEQQLTPIQRTPPHILIGTPQALLDIVQKDPKALPLDRLSTIVVDEVDYLIETVPMLADKRTMAKLERKINQHPGPTRLLLNHIYSSANERLEKTSSHQGKHSKRELEHTRPQLVMMSATLRNHLRKFLLADSGWFTKESGKLVRITGEVSPHDPKKPQATEDVAEGTIGGTGIEHHVLVVSKHGDVKNIEGAIENPAVASQESKVTTSSDDQAGLPPQPESSQAPDDDVELGGCFSILTTKAALILTLATDVPPQLNPDALEAVAAAFAIDVPSVALLVLPSDASVQRVVNELSSYGVNARPLDVVKDKSGRAHLMRQDLDAIAENPTLLVATLASTRGLDLPELKHVFILGVLDNGAVDSYLHVAGRVGRFGRGGKVISVVAERHTVQSKNGKKVVRDEPKMMLSLLRKAGIRPVVYDKFD
ncbi:P-loop containing nucleoside triphosphate hydrolase protein [Cubamyces lactineus]|nr:P-loop containing nucleoside triphosphate hydrolase protein [Cubamyces lactineus]